MLFGKSAPFSFSSLVKSCEIEEALESSVPSSLIRLHNYCLESILRGNGTQRTSKLNRVWTKPLSSISVYPFWWYSVLLIMSHIQLQKHRHYLHWQCKASAFPRDWAVIMPRSCLVFLSIKSMSYRCINRELTISRLASLVRVTVSSSWERYPALSTSRGYCVRFSCLIPPESQAKS